MIFGAAHNYKLQIMFARVCEKVQLLHDKIMANKIICICIWMFLRVSGRECARERARARARV